MSIEIGSEKSSDKQSTISHFSRTGENPDLIQMMESSETQIDPNEEEQKDARQQ